MRFISLKNKVVSIITRLFLIKLYIFSHPIFLGWDYYVQEHKEPEFRKKMYADNYKYSPGKLRIIKTK